MELGTITTQFFNLSNPGYPNTHVKQDNELKSHLMEMIEAFKEDIKNLLKKTQENTGKQVEAHKDETNKSLKVIQKNTIMQVR